MEHLFMAVGILAACTALGVIAQGVLNTALWAVNLILDLKEAGK